MNAKELRVKTIEELKKLLIQTRESLRALKLEGASRKLKNVSQIAKSRHLIARILTIIKEKEKKI